MTKAVIGKYLNLSGIIYKVVGVYKDDGGDDEERVIYMPLTTRRKCKKKSMPFPITLLYADMEEMESKLAPYFG